MLGTLRLLIGLVLIVVGLLFEGTVLAAVLGLLAIVYLLSALRLLS